MLDYHERLTRTSEELDRQNTRWNAHLRWNAGDTQTAYSMAISGMKRANHMHQAQSAPAPSWAPSPDLSERLQQRRGEADPGNTSQPRLG